MSQFRQLGAIALVIGIWLICVASGVAQSAPAPTNAADPSPFASSTEPLAQPLQSQNETERDWPTPFPTALGGFGNGYGGLRGLGTVGGLNNGGLFGVHANFAFVGMPDQPVSNQPANLGYVAEGVSISAPAWRNETDSVAWSLHARATNYSTDAILPDSGRAFPDSLYNIGAGLTYTHMFDGWSAGGMFSIGSASDRPFASMNEINLGVGGFVRIPTSEMSGWMIGAMYSATGELPFPIPIVAYSWQPSQEFGMNIGLPFSIRWKPIDDLLLEASYVPIRTVHTRATYRIADGIGIYGGFDWSNDAYLLADRSDTEERLFYYEKTISLGLRYDFGPTTALDLSGGYAFDRFYFTGRQWTDNQHDRIDVGDGLFFALRFQLRY